MPRTPSLYLPSRLYAGATRRRFLQGSAAAIAGVTLANCQPRVADVQGNPNAATPTAAPGNSSDQKLHIFTWANYTDDKLNQEFTKRTGIPVVVDIFDSNESMLAKLQAGGGSAYSIIYPSDYMVQQMRDLDLLTELDHSRVQGMENFFDQWKNPVYDPNNQHSIPVVWGSTGLLYNKEQVPAEPKDWDFLWENQQELSRRITMMDDPRETMGATLKSLGHSYNTTDPKQIEEAYNRLVELKPAIASFLSYGYEDGLLGGDLAVVMAYSTDALATILEDDRLAYIVPESGASVWTDTMVIPKGAPNPDAAYEWLNFYQDVAIARQLVELLSNSTPNQAVFEELPEEFRNNTTLFPTPETLAKCEGVAPIGEATDVFDKFWTRLTAS